MKQTSLTYFKLAVLYKGRKGKFWNGSCLPTKRFMYQAKLWVSQHYSRGLVQEEFLCFPKMFTTVDAGYMNYFLLLLSLEYTRMSGLILPCFARQRCYKIPATTRRHSHTCLYSMSNDEFVIFSAHQYKKKLGYYNITQHFRTTLYFPTF